LLDADLGGYEEGFQTASRTVMIRRQEGLNGRELL